MANEVEVTATARQGSVEIQYTDGTDAIPGIDPKMRQLANQLSRWVDQARATTNRATMFDRGKYVSSDNVYDQMRTARAAVKDDDVVSSTAELTEGMAFQGVKWESEESDEADIFNQMAAEQNLDDVVRKIWREEFTYGQGVLGFWWTEGTFKVRGKTENDQARRKTVKVWYPKAVTVLDLTKIVPVGMLAFGQDRLAWQATRGEIASYNAVAMGELQDELMERFYSGQYIVRDEDELVELTQLKVDPTKLILLDDRYVRRFHITKPDYERFADVRIKSVFRLLDLKQQLMEADRVTLVGAANYILLVKKGDKDDPAYPEEIANLKENFNYIAKLPVIFSDHRLTIEIITPKQDLTLNPEKYDVLDNRIIARLLNTITAVSSRSGQRGDDTLKLGRPVARSLENRRHMIRRFLEREIAKAVVEHPKNKGIFKSEPNLTYMPRRIQLDDDTGIAQGIIQLRMANELSRESTLEYFGFDQAVEAMRRDFEEASGYDDTFQTMVPFSSPAGGAAVGGAGNQQSNPGANGAAGGAGGRPKGGGKPSQNPAAAPRRTSTGTTKGTK